MQELISWLKKMRGLVLAKYEHRTQSLRGDSGFVHCEGKRRVLDTAQRGFDFSKKQMPGTHAI